MKVPFIDFELQNKNFLERGKLAFENVLLNENLIGGNSVDQFTKDFNGLHGLSHGITCANGTDALELALTALGVKTNDEVIIPALSWASTLTSVMRIGGRPVFIDVDSNYFTLDPEHLEKLISPRTKAVVAVHLHGLAANMPEIKSICQKKNIGLVEDASQAHMASLGKQMVGAFGDISTFSFYPTKNLGAYGDAGLIATNNSSYATEIENTSRIKFSRIEENSVPRNSRMDTLQAAFLLQKLPLLNEWIAKRRRIARLYNNAFSDFDITTPAVPDSFKHVFHHYTVLHDKRDLLKGYLEEKNIGTEIHYDKTLAELVGLSGSQMQLPVALSITKKTLSLPNYPEMNDGQIEYVIKNVREFLLKHA